MKFPYQPLIWFDGLTRSFDDVMRPEIELTVHGPSASVSYSALVDTGADQVVLPCSLARRLGVTLDPSRTRPAKVFGGSCLAFQSGKVELEVGPTGQSVRWATTVCFLDFDSQEDEVLILGHAGFLDYFTASFDGEQAELTLRPNDRVPIHNSI